MKTEYELGIEEGKDLGRMENANEVHKILEKTIKDFESQLQKINDPNDIDELLLKEPTNNHFKWAILLLKKNFSDYL